jgi:hypothetical protein
MKKPIWYQISKKKYVLAGARTHENETRPEEIYEDQSLAVTKMFSHLDMTLMFSLIVILIGMIIIHRESVYTNQKGQMPPRRLFTLTRGIQIRGQPIKNYNFFILY